MKRQKEENSWEITKRWAVTILLYGYLCKLILGETLFHNPYKHEQISGCFLLTYAPIFWVALSHFHPVITAVDCGNRGSVPYFLSVPANLLTGGAGGSQQWQELQILPALKFFQLDICSEVHVSSYLFLPGTWLLKRLCYKLDSFVLNSLNIWFLALNFGAVCMEKLDTVFIVLAQHSFCYFPSGLGSTVWPHRAESQSHEKNENKQQIIIH